MNIGSVCRNYVIIRPGLKFLKKPTETEAVTWDFSINDIS